MSHELHPLDQTPIEKFYIFRDYSHSDEIIFKMPTENDLPGMLQPHHIELTNVVKRIQELYTEAEVKKIRTEVDIFLSDGQFCIFFSKLVRDIDLILFAS